MKLIRGLHNWPRHLKSVITTIGNFDGLHLGHQQMIDQLVDVAHNEQRESVLIIMEPQPQEYFLGQKAAARLTRLREKLCILKTLGVDWVLCLNFNNYLASLSGEHFIKKILVDTLRIDYILVGDDFHFGQHRSGDYSLLKALSEQYDYQVSHMDTIELNTQRVSSTRVRQALTKGNLKLAETLLGRKYSMCGRVAHGHKRGRQWGIPTANIYLHRAVSPIQGVYVVQVKGIDQQIINGVANVGTRPTVDGSYSLLEVHLFDFNQDIYGKYIEVEFIDKLRDERRFKSNDELKQSIFNDIETAKLFFINQPTK